MSETIIHESRDEHGTIIVTDDGKQRVLKFADYDEQSCCLKTEPHVLQYEYTQAMLLVLLFCQPKRVLLLGLGGGSLVTALHHYISGIHITSVELRQQVIEVAYHYFQLPRGKRLPVICQSADECLQGNNLRKVDVLFADLYHAKGADQSQLQAVFVQRCAAQIKDNGWLVLNGWTEHRDNPEFLEALCEHFTDIRTALTGSHNWIILAGKVKDSQGDKQLKDKAFKLSLTLGFSLTRHLARLKPLGR